ncbi:MAG: sugar transferase [Bacillota bacterium]|nr:sugar transferase [Bacillota bacterium]
MAEPSPGWFSEAAASASTAVGPAAGPAVSPWCHGRGKRLLDVIGATLLTLLGLPVIALTAAAVALSSGRPVLYRQVRLGQGMRPLTVLKFRTMRRDAEAETGPVFASPGDPRITPVGRFLRRSRLDETPQLLCVLRGEMSLVGPRPERPVFVRQFMDEIPGYAGRFATLPGLTGPAQVAESYHATAREKLVHDLDYRARACLAMDLEVLARTILVVLRGGGR